MTLDVSLDKPYSLGATGVVTLTRTDRLSLGAMFRPLATALTAGSGFLVGPTGTNGELTLLTDVLLRVAPFIASIQGTHSTQQGQYVVPNPTQRDLAVPAKDASLFRRALIVVRVADSIEAGVASSATTDGAWLEILPGPLAASNPQLPSMAAYANYLAAGELSIPSTASGQPVTITKYNPRAVLRGQVYPVTDRAARLAIPAADRYPGLDVLELDKGRSWRWDGIGWDLIGGQRPHLLAYTSAAAQPVNAGWNEIYLTNEVVDTDNALTPIVNNIPASSRFYAPFDGYYRCNGQVAFAPAAAGQVLRAAQFSTNGRDRLGSTVPPFNGTGAAGAALGSTGVMGYTPGSVALCTPVNPRRIYLLAGEWVSMWAYSNVATTVQAFSTNDVGQQTFFEVVWDGAR